MSPFVRPHSVRRADRLLARAVFLLSLALYTATFVGYPENPDAEVEFQTTRSLWHDHSYAMGDTPEAEFIVEQRFDVREGSGERAGRFYSWFGIGQAWVGLPFYATGRLLARAFPGIESRHESLTHYGIGRSEYFEHLLVAWRNPLFGALTVWLVFLAARRMGASRPGAFLAALAYGTCTFAWPQARSTLSDVQATLLLFGAFDLLLRFREAFERFHRPRRVQLFLFGGALGLAFLTRLVTAPVILVLLVLFVSLLVRGRRIGSTRATWVDAAIALVPAAAGLVLFFYTNHLRFGDPLESGYGAAVGRAFFGYPPLLGAFGLAFAPGKGLLFLAPPILLAGFGWTRAWRHAGSLTVLGSVAFALAVAVPIFFVESWHGAWTFGPRYILPLLPIAFVFVAHGLDRIGGSLTGRLFAGALCAFGFVANLGGVLVDHMTHQDLALQAMRIAWTDAPGVSEEERDNKRFERIQFDWRFAAPWAHWRILRHRVAGMGEEFSAREIFFVEPDTTLRSSDPALHGFRHLAWVDFKKRLDGPVGIVVVLLIAMCAAAFLLALRGFDPASH